MADQNDEETYKERPTEEISEEDYVIQDGLRQRIERWYILLIFGSLSFMTMFLWNAYGPIADVAQYIFNWSDANIAMLYNWNSITFVLLSFPAASLVDRYGLRSCVVGSALLVLLAAGVRCMYFVGHTAVNTMLQNLSAILNGLPVLLSAPTIVSAVWFPASQRTVATSLIVLLNALGYALAFVLGPVVVPNHFSTNHTAFADDQSKRDEAIHSLFGLFYVTFGVSAFLALCALVHFPSQPLHAPSATAAERREPFRVGLRRLARSGAFWSLFISYSLVVGIAGSWTSLIFIVLRPLGTHSELDAGCLGCLTNCLQGFLSVLFAHCADANIRHSKRIITIALLLSGILYLCFALMATGYIPLNVVLLDFCIVCATSITSGLTPIYFELTNEVCYPASESLCTLSLFSGNQLASSLFYSTLSVVYSLTDGTMEPHRHHWSATCLFWTPLTSVIISLLPFAFFRAQFNRFHLDSTQKARKQQSVELDDTIEIESAILLN